MYKILSILFGLILIPNLLTAQLLPAEGSKLNYRIIGFSFPAETVQGRKCKIEIAIGHIDSDETFRQKMVRSVITNKNKVIAEVPYFGLDYTWRVVYADKTSKKSVSPLHHFSIDIIPEIDTCNMRLRVISKAVKHKDDYVFVDGNKALYNMNGDPVWYLPIKNKATRGNPLVRDLKLSPENTLTFLYNEEPYEINYDGAVLWTGPNDGRVSGGDSENYHHEFTRLANGHYMVLGNELVNWEHNTMPAADSSADSLIKSPKKTAFGTLIEYDEKNKVVWSWKSSKYFMNSDLVNFKSNNKKNLVDVHENAFYFDERDSIVYISFKNISRILKIKYPEGNVLNSYGETFRRDTPATGNGLFCEQHACRRSRKGYLFLYNNNSCNDEKSLPEVLMMQEPAAANDPLTIVWKYECTIDDININSLLKKARARQRLLGKKDMGTKPGITSQLHATNGGNVLELPDGSVFVCMNTQYSKVFIVSPDKKILWSATPEKWRAGKNAWFATPLQYKASIITRKELEQLIWNEQGK